MFAESSSTVLVSNDAETRGRVIFCPARHRSRSRQLPNFPRTHEQVMLQRMTSTTTSTTILSLAIRTSVRAVDFVPGLNC
eukprot:1344560-Rhodomonas_salina.1